MNLGEILNNINIDEEVHGFLASVYHRNRLGKVYDKKRNTFISK